MPECEENSTIGVSTSQQWLPEWSEWAIPKGEQCKRWTPKHGACAHPDHFDNTTIECDNYVYEHGSSIVAEVSFILDIKTMTSLGCDKTLMENKKKRMNKN